MNEIIENNTATGNVKDEEKNRAIIAHITMIGWVIALIMNNDTDKKSEFASFYIRQMLGLFLMGIASGFLMILLIGFVFYIIVIIFWIISLIGAVNGEKKELPVVGPLFQQWFASL